MHPTLCSRCHKNMAVVFINRIENGVTQQEGLCLKCARELHIKPIDDIIAKMGISDEDLESLGKDMMESLQSITGGDDGLMQIENSEDDSDDDGKTATFPFLNRLFGAQGGPVEEHRSEPGGEAPRERGAKPERKPKRKFLDSYCISLTDRARDGKLDRMVGREEELERVIQILNRRQKNNPCLIGEPGVGKTAIAEGLAQRIAKGSVPYKLREKQVFLLDLTSLVAGTQFRGQFESRMKGLIEEIRREGNIILVIDEVHNLVGAGDAEGSMNAANILKPALSRGEIQVIGATTFTEYRKHIEKDAALERRFQPVTVSEPSLEDSVEILKGIRGYYEDFHKVRISDDMCRMAVSMSERYITDRYLPDKAIDLIDEACSDVSLHNHTQERIEEIRKECADLDRERELLLQDTKDEDFERLAQLRSRDLQLKSELSRLEGERLPSLTADNLARIIELWTKIPASSIRADEFERLSGLADRLRARVIGQDAAIASVCAAIKRNRTGLQAKRKPVSFIFVGSTGVGKTELVKRLAEDLFNAPESLIRLDMSEFMEKHSVSRIIGSPPGYVGYDEAGQLTEKVRRKPYSVILFDEIEKAHPDVMNILLQILDEGKITDAQGRTVAFDNTVIVMTSNAGSERTDTALGFGKTAESASAEKAMKALREFLRPEFIGRVDEVVIFRPLDQNDFEKIAVLMLDELVEPLRDKGITFTYTQEAVRLIAERSIGGTRGARELRNYIRRNVEDRIATKIIDSVDHPISAIRADVRDGELVVE